MLDKSYEMPYAFSMTLKRIIALMRKHQPRTPDEFESVTGAKLEHVATACFREVYTLNGLYVAIKFPLKMDGDFQGWSIRHSRREIRRIQKIQSQARFRHLRRYTPRVHFVNKKTGVILMEWIYDAGEVPSDHEQIVANLFKDTIRTASDISAENLGFDGRKQIKVLDMGCV